LGSAGLNSSTHNRSGRKKGPEKERHASRGKPGYEKTRKREFGNQIAAQWFVIIRSRLKKRKGNLRYQERQEC